VLQLFRNVLRRVTCKTEIGEVKKLLTEHRVNCQQNQQLQNLELQVAIIPKQNNQIV